jgi:hypothetical protein
MTARPDTTAPRVTTPEEFFGFRLGSDQRVARWDRIVEYFQRLASESDRIKVIELGKSTEGHPFLLTIISSPENLADLERVRLVNARLADPRGLSEAEAATLARDGKAVICQSMSLHASEIGGTQMAPELAFELVSTGCGDEGDSRCGNANCGADATAACGDATANRRILDNVIFLMIPCFNPDGQTMVTDWYHRYLGTEYEGASLPWLYHQYAGHDNNRDAFAQNLVESRYVAQVLFRDWHPHAYQDHHHMGSYGPRLYIAPYCEPIHPYADPLIWREEAWYGAHMAYKLEEHGKTGILNAGQFPGWAHMGFHWLAAFHNTPSMLTESASAKLASPLFIHPDQLEGPSKKSMPKYEPQTNFPHPWPGGWWRLRDIVEQQKVSAWALLDLAARHRETVVWNGYLKAKRQTERGAVGAVGAAGASGGPFAFIIATARQHDPPTARKLVQVLLNQGLEMKVATAPFEVDGRTYPAGTHVVFLAQPKMGVARTLLERTFFPDNYWTRNPDGSPIIYDTATDTIAEFMGVKVVRADEPFTGEFVVVEREREAAGAAAAGPVGTAGGVPRDGAVRASPRVAGYFLDGRHNDSFRAANRLLAAGAAVWRVEGRVKAEVAAASADTSRIEAGAFYVEAGAFYVEAGALADELGLDLIAAAAPPAAPARLLRPLRIGLYQRYWGGNMDEGWTRLLFDQFEVPYVTLRDDAIKAGGLRERFDVIVFPSDRKSLIVDVTKADKSDPRAVEMLKWFGDTVPPEYRSGIGDEGVRAVADFVTAGGRLVALDAASTFAIDACGLKVKNVLDGLTFKEFHCPGSTLRVKVDTAHPLAWGMPPVGLALHWRSPAFAIEERFRAENYRIVASFAPKDVLESGWLVGEDRIASRAAMVAARRGEGEVVLFGFRPQFRAQTHGTFKLLFNCLI